MDLSLLNQNLILQINSKVRKTYDKLSKIPTTGFIEITKSTTLNWSAKSIDIVQNGINIFHIHSPNVRNLFFHASWWELIVARAISQWPKAKSYYYNANYLLNQIPILQRMKLMSL